MSSATTIADQGLKAFNASNYAEAITLYTTALGINPEAPDYYLKRSIAYQRSSQYELALHDAEIAVLLANRRGKRELIGSAQLRRGIALHLLGRYGDAGFCFNEAEKRCGEKEKNMLGIWRKKLEMALEKTGEDDVSREVTIEEIPQVEIPKASDKVTELEADKPKEATKDTGTSTGPGPAAATNTTTTTPVAAPPPSPAGVITPASKIRHEWYQTSTHVVLTLYVKGVPKDKASIEIKSKTLSISFPLPSGNDFVFDIDPFFDHVVPSESTSTILSTKVEVKLQKANPGKKWADFEGVHEDDPEVKPVVETKPMYPSSSKTGSKDWEQLAKELTAKPKNKGKGKEGEAGGGDGESEYDSDEGGDPVNYFFKKLYKDADEDTKRAMMKSYTESNGTALSTNWSEVGKGKVETSPPEGMTAKKWGE